MTAPATAEAVARRHPTLPKKYGYGDAIMLSAHDPTQPWYALEVTKERITFNPDFRAPRGIVRVPPKRAAWARERIAPDEILLEPHIKGRFSASNKRWPWTHWTWLVGLARAHGYRLVQPIQPGRAALEGVRSIPTPTFWHAVALLEAARGLVTTDGGLHHAAGALHRPAVVIWGAYSPPAILGYPDHVNLDAPDPAGLGQRRPHPACERAMQRITPQQVLNGMQQLWP